MAHDFIAVDIVSDRDFDAAHPAGTSLADIAMFIALSPYRYIQSGYQDFDWGDYGDYELFYDFFHNSFIATHHSTGIGSLYPVKALVSDLTPDDLAILGLGTYRNEVGQYYDNLFAVIEFTRMPEVEKTHTLSVTFKTDTGKTFHNTVTLEFD